MRLVRASMLLSVLLLAGCEMAAELSEMQNKMVRINSDLKNELGVEAQVGWNIHNGTLTQITVLLPADQVKDRSIQQLKEITYPIVMRHFDSPPQVFQLAAVFQGPGE